MSAIDLNLKFTKAMAKGRGSVVISQEYIDIMRECGALDCVYKASLKELECRKRNAPARFTSAETSGFTAEPTAPTLKSSGMIPQADVNDAYQRAQAALKQPRRPSTVDTSKAKARKSATPADAHLTQSRAG